MPTWHHSGNLDRPCALRCQDSIALPSGRISGVRNNAAARGARFDLLRQGSDESRPKMQSKDQGRAGQNSSVHGIARKAGAGAIDRHLWEHDRSLRPIDQSVKVNLCRTAKILRTPLVAEAATNSEACGNTVRDVGGGAVARAGGRAGAQRPWLESGAGPAEVFGGSAPQISCPTDRSGYSPGPFGGYPEAADRWPSG